MQELEKILEEIKVSSVYAEVADGYGAMCVSIGTIECIIRKHMNDGNDINVAAKDDGWIPVERLHFRKGRNRRNSVHVV